MTAERLMAGLYTLNSLLPNDGPAVNPPHFADFVRDMAADAYALPVSRPLPGWLVHPGVGALLIAYQDGSLPYLTVAAKKLEDAGRINDLDRIGQHDICDRATVPCQLSTPAVWTPLWRSGTSHALLVTVALDFGHDVGTADDSAVDDDSGSAWIPLSPDLRSQATKAMEVGAAFLEDAGLPSVAIPAAEPAMHRLPRSLEPEILYAAPAVALTFIASRLGLPSPTELGVVVLGGGRKPGEWSAVDEHLVDALYQGSEMDAVVFRTAKGWTRKSAPSDSGDVTTDASIAGAAALLWGSGWEAALEGARQELLKKAGWSWSTMVTPRRRGQTKDSRSALPMVESGLVGNLVHKFATASGDSKTTAAIVGGPPSSGKSVIAAQVARKLLTKGWRILVLTPERHELPSADDMTAIVRSALLLADIERTLRTLVILEDLYPVRSTNIGDVVGGVQIALAVPVLAVARYETASGSEWDSGAVDHFPSIAGQQALIALAKKLSQQHPAVYGANRSDVAPLVRAAGGDLELLCRLLAATTRTAEEEVTSQRLVELRDEMINRLFAEAPELAEPIRLLAATSLLGCPLNCRQLDADVVQSLVDRGARRRGDSLLLSSVFFSKLILTRGALDDVASLRATVVALIGGYLSDLLTSGEDQAIADLVRACRVYDPDLLVDLLDSDAIGRDLRYWVGRADVRTAAFVLLAFEFVSKHKQTAGLVLTLLRRVSERSDLSARELGSVLRVVHRYREDLEHSVETGEQAYTTFFDRLADPEAGLEGILARAGTLSERVEVAYQLAKMSRPDLNALLLDNTAGFLHGVRPSAEHYRLLRKLDQHLERCRPKGVPDDGQRMLSAYDRVQELQEGRPPSGAGFDALASWMSFQVYFGGPNVDREELLTRNRFAFLTALSKAGAAEIAQGLDEFYIKRDVFTWMINVLLYDSPLPDYLINALRSAQPAEAAALVSATGRIHGAVMRYVLYEPTDGVLIPRKDLAQRLAKHVADAKGISMLLSSVHQVDEWFMPGGDGFAFHVAESLGEETARNLVRMDPRSSVLYYFFRALWLSGATYWSAVEQEAFDAIVTSLRTSRSFVRPWAPHLALLVAEDDHLGEEFLRDLGAEVDENTLLRQMTAPARADALTHLHRLGRALHPKIAQRFITAYDADKQLRPLLTVPPQALVEYLRVTAETLGIGGLANANRYLADEIRRLDPEFDWEARFRRIYRPADLAQGLFSFARFDHVRAVELVHQLGEGDDGSPSHLHRMMLRAAKSPSELTDLLTACRRLSPQLGDQLLTDLRNTPWAWQVFRVNLQWEQQPLEQCRVGIQLARLGLTASGDNAAWMRGELLDKRWMKVAPVISSPHLMSSVLRLLYIWAAPWARELAASLDVERLVRRLQKLGPGDVAYIPALINVFSLARDTETTTRIIDMVGAADQSVLAHRLGLRGGGELLHQLTREAPGMVRNFAPAFAEELGAALRRRIVVDQAAYWRELGWAAAALRRRGLGNLIPDDGPILLPNQAYAAEVAWAATWLDRPGLLDEPLQRAIDDLASRSGTGDHANRIAMIAIAAARADRVESILDDEANASQIGHAGLGMLTVAIETAARHQGLAALLDKLKPTLNERVRKPAAATDPYLPAVKAFLAGG
ncbi:hypothetical protein OHA18_31590 [Kribbella sp. NBC_00709]|uniref:hypothetical protein n=1 Tax=Kribbella sp. NBC_00709 TaxID=2975972 RepID=UPI002E27BA8A|nr:hypothetical protein [Kribbella sp. NBC_00709]